MNKCFKGGECKELETENYNLCWCRDPTQLCGNGQVCHEHKCRGECPHFPTYSNSTCHCNKKLVCSPDQICKNDACEPLPPICELDEATLLENGCSCQVSLPNFIGRPIHLVLRQ